MPRRRFTRPASFAILLAVYGAAFAAAILVVTWAPFESPLATAALADGVATALVFACSVLVIVSGFFINDTSLIYIFSQRFTSVSRICRARQHVLVSELRLFQSKTSDTYFTISN